MTTVLERNVMQEPLGDEIKRLQAYVSRMERRYECPSAFALEAVRLGQMRETAEIARWLISYRTLQRLEDYAG